VGSTFVATLPRSLVAVKRSSSSTTTRLNIKLARKVLRERPGYEVHSAGDATTAFAQLELVRPRLIIMDLRLPGMDGFELAQKIQARPALQPHPIIAMTASGFADDEQRARLAGCDDYMEAVRDRTLDLHDRALRELDQPIETRETSGCSACTAASIHFTGRRDPSPRSRARA